MLVAQGGYAAALNEYFHAYKQARREPLTLLCLAVTMLNQVMSKKVPDRDRAVLQVFAFLQASPFCLRCHMEIFCRKDYQMGFHLTR
jgi:hypothetical protein